MMHSRWSMVVRLVQLMIHIHNLTPSPFDAMQMTTRRCQDSDSEELDNSPLAFLFYPIRLKLTTTSTFLYLTAWTSNVHRHQLVLRKSSTLSCNLSRRWALNFSLLIFKHTSLNIQQMLFLFFFLFRFSWLAHRFLTKEKITLLSSHPVAIAREYGIFLLKSLAPESDDEMK